MSYEPYAPEEDDAMDPDANLAEQLDLSHEILTATSPPTEDEARRLAELVQALHDWITRGGFLPKRWKDGAPF